MRPQYRLKLFKKNNLAHVPHLGNIRGKRGYKREHVLFPLVPSCSRHVPHRGICIYILLLITYVSYSPRIGYTSPFFKKR